MRPIRRKPCPYCGEPIAVDALKCRFCREFLDDPAAASPALPVAGAPLPAASPVATALPVVRAAPGPGIVATPRQPLRPAPRPVQLRVLAGGGGEPLALADAGADEPVAEALPARLHEPAPFADAGADDNADADDYADDCADEEDEDEGWCGVDERAAEPEDEPVPYIYRGTCSKALLIWPGLASALLLAAFFYLRWQGIALFRSLGGGLADSINLVAALQVASLTAGIIFFLILLKKWVKLAMITFCISEERVEYETGIFARSIENIDMWRVKDLSFSQTVPQALLGLGTITLLSTDKTSPVLQIGPIRRARQVYDQLKRAMLQADRKSSVIHLER